MYYRKAKDSLLKVSMGALMSAEKSPVRTLMVGPIVLTWARHSDTDVETYLKLMSTSTTAIYDLGRVRADAWDEGFTAGVNHDLGDWDNPPNIIKNPYRKD